MIITFIFYVIAVGSVQAVAKVVMLMPFLNCLGWIKKKEGKKNGALTDFVD